LSKRAKKRLEKQAKPGNDSDDDNGAKPVTVNLKRQKISDD
jgi:hypothetical protein